MNRKGLIASLMAVAIICSCAHKSGHRLPAAQGRHPQRSAAQGEAPVVSRPSGRGSKMDGSEIFQRYHSAVFMIYTTDGTNLYQGSGFFIDSHGLAVSNYHVVSGATSAYVKLENDETAHNITHVYASDEEEDFIIFRTDCPQTTAIPLAAQKPMVGDRVFAIGSPHGFENTFSSGEVSAWRDNHLMQINAAIDHGSSGGALINEYGQVVGITSGTLYEGSQANLNYAWSIEALKPYIIFR